MPRGSASRGRPGEFSDALGAAELAEDMPVLELGVRAFAVGFPGHLAELAELPRHLTAAVGGHRVAIMHGDPESLAGWKLAMEAVEPAD